MRQVIKVQEHSGRRGRTGSSWSLPVSAPDEWEVLVRRECGRWAGPTKAGPLAAIVSELIQNAGKALLKKAWSASTPGDQQTLENFRALLADDSARARFLRDAGEVVFYLEQRGPFLRVVVANPGLPTSAEWEKIRAALTSDEDDVMESVGSGEGGGIGIGLVRLLMRGLGVASDSLRIYDYRGWTVSRVHVRLNALK